MLLVLIERDRLDMNVLHDRNPVFTQLSDGSIRNGYTIKVLNMKPEPRKFQLVVSGLPSAQMTMVGSDNIHGSSVVVEIAPDKLRAMKIFVSEATVHSRPTQ